MSGLRAESVGTDTETYSNIFAWIRDGSVDYIEPLYVLINQLIIFFDGSFNALLLFLALLTFSPLCYVIVKNTKNYCFSLFIYYSLYIYCNSFNLMRQVLAMSFVLLFYYYLSERKHIIKSFFSISIAFFIHYSALVALACLLLLKIKLNRKVIYITLLVSLLFGLFIAKTSFLSILLGPYAIYLESDSLGIRPSIVVPFILSLILSLLFVFMYETSYKSNNFPQKIFFLFILCNNLTFTLVLGARIILYYSIGQVVYIPYYLKKTKIKQVPLLYVIITSYLALLFFKILFDNGADVYPYIIAK